MPSRLKFLELYGYKTFAARTNFEFASTITAIVGPNGSGKSNIADAIRWVLGEQSFHLLRGKKTEDMIFSGSEQRPRAGMASATIVFDNDDAWLPIDFSEVAITRRAYRDGENEYLLNGQRVRLRDVSELLAQSGLAERTYTVIGQGLVDAALSLKAEERRRLFEEAAGIGLHRSRREEALKRLDVTRRNLERVQDILAELQPRLRSLERQARRAQEYEQIKADLRLLLLEWYGYHWHKSQNELRKAREAARMQEKILERANQERAAFDEKIRIVRDKIQQPRARLGEWHLQSAQCHTQREIVMRNMAVAEERIKSVKEYSQNFNEEMTRLEEELEINLARLATSRDEVSTLQDELAEAQIQAEAARQALQARQVERDDCEEKVQAARQELSILTANQAHLQARKVERQAHIERQNQALLAASQAVSTTEEEIRDAENRLKASTMALNKIKIKHQAAEEALQSYRQQIDKVEIKRKEALEERGSKAAESARWQAQLDVLEQAEKALSGYSSGAKLLIEAARQSRLKGARGALSSYLEVPEEYEVAIAAAFGEFVDTVLLDEEGDPLQALDLLSDQSARGVLLPLGSLDNLPPNNSSLINGEMKGVLGLATELVKAPVEIQAAVNMFLGQTWVVQDRQAARRLIKALPGASNSNGSSAGFRAVTLRGEVFYASGLIVAGQEDKPATLRRPRQRRELHGSLAEIDRHLQSLENEIGGLDRKLIHLHEKEGQLVQEEQQTRKQEDEARATQRQNELILEGAQQHLQWQREQHTRLVSEIEDMGAEVTRTSAELSQLEGEITMGRELLRQLGSDLMTLSLEETQTQLAHWNTRLAVAERALLEAQNRLQERRLAVERARGTQERLLTRQVENQALLEGLEQEIISLQQQEQQYNEQIEILRTLIEPVELDLKNAEKEQVALQKVEVEVRQALSVAEHYHAQAKIALAKRQEALESLRHRIEDDFGLVAFEYEAEVSGPTPLPLNGMVEQLPTIAELSTEIEESIRRQRGQLQRMGAVNPDAQVEYQEVKQRYEFLTEQVADLQKAESDIKEVITELDLLMEREFRRTFDAVSQEFREIFIRLFGGGSARLVLTDPESMTDTGIDIEARLPGRRAQGLSLLSGGERSLTATSLVFALLKVSPTPFCVLDEVDAMLDEVNVGRFRDLLYELSQNTQFIVVTHNRNTVQVADVIYGVTMGRDSTSQVLSLKLDEVSKVVD